MGRNVGLGEGPLVGEGVVGMAVEGEREGSVVVGDRDGSAVVGLVVGKGLGASVTK